MTSQERVFLRLIMLSFTLAGAATTALSSPPDGSGPAIGKRLFAPKKAKHPSFPVLLTLTTDHPAYGPHHPISLTITVKNVAKSSITLHFPTSQRYEIILRQERGNKPEPIWHWSEGRVFLDALGALTLEPGKTTAYRVVYDPAEKSAAGKSQILSPASYSFLTSLTTQGNEPKPTATAVFRIHR